MPLWGANSSNEAKPNWLNNDEKSRTYATSQGWVIRHDKGHGGSWEEVLVATGQLDTTFANANISTVYFANASYTQGANGFVTVAFNEKVVVTGSPTIPVYGSGTSGNTTATYSSGTGTNKLLFKFTTPSVTQNLYLYGGTTITLAGGTIKDQGAVNATLTYANTVIASVRNTTGSANVAVA